MIRKETYPVDKIFPLVVNPDMVERRKVNLDGDMIKVSSWRLYNFKMNGCTCVKCGITGSFFAKEKSSEKNDGSYHLNLYAIDKDGNEVLMTKDHVTPKSVGGKNRIENYQTMCVLCNEEKGNGKQKNSKEKKKEIKTSKENDKNSIAQIVKIEKYTADAKEEFEKLPKDIQDVVRKWSLRWIDKAGAKRMGRILTGRRTIFNTINEEK